MGHDRWELCTYSGCSDRERAPADVQFRLLNSLQYGRSNQSVYLFLRRLVYESDPDAVARFEDHQIIDSIRMAFAMGRVHLCRPLLRENEGSGAPPKPAVAEDPIKPKRLTKTWVEFEVVDMEGNPAVGCKYKVMLPDGSLHEGTLDKTGIVRFENIDPENSVFTLPDLDRDAWERV